MDSIGDAVEEGVETVARGGIEEAADEAISEAVEARMDKWVAGCTEPMLLQLF
jgi:hypothetical protein